jgi:hypothetical protein
MAIGFQVTFDAADPATLGHFWGDVLGYIEQPPPKGFDSWDAFLESIGVPDDERDSAYAVVDPDGRGPRLYFQKVPEGKTAKNRVHLDVNVGGPMGTPLDERRHTVDEKVAEVVARGGAKVRAVDERDEYWVVMADPEGNEFCIQ